MSEREVVVTCSAGLTLIVKIPFATLGGCCESATETVNDEGPAVVGVPEMAPVLLSVSPAGRFAEETFQAYGATPPVAVTNAL